MEAVKREGEVSPTRAREHPLLEASRKSQRSFPHARAGAPVIIIRYIPKPMFPPRARGST